MKIAFLHAYDTRDRGSWSGINYYIARALEKYCGEVSHISPLPHAKQELIGRIIHKGTRVLLKKNFRFHCSFLYSQRFAKVASQKLAGKSFDVIVAPAGATEIAFLETDIPIVSVDDATYGQLLNYYPAFTNLMKRSVYEVQTIQCRALNKAHLLIYSSEWAARSAIEDYATDPRKVHVVPFGANIEHPPSKEFALKRKKSDRCQLLLMGVDWETKGGPIAFEILLKLEEMGIAAELIVCGCTPPATFSHRRMRVIPFLDKNDTKQLQELEQLYITSDFLLLPTRNDCTPIVFCEANAFGLPVITTRTGGIPEVIRDGENGVLLPYNARGDAYAAVIAKIYRDEQRYTELVRASRAAFEDRLNWDAWGVVVKQLMTELLCTTPALRQPNELPDV